jgi:hypothetical protein
MKMRMGAAVLVAVGTLLGVTGCAGTSEARRDISAVVPGLEQNWRGVVMRVDDQANAIAVRAVESAEMPQAAWFAIDQTTILERDGERISIMQLEQGTPVKVSFEPAAGAEKTYRVKVLTGQEAQEVLQEARRQMEQQMPRMRMQQEQQSQ